MLGVTQYSGDGVNAEHHQRTDFVLPVSQNMSSDNTAGVPLPSGVEFTVPAPLNISDIPVPFPASDISVSIPVSDVSVPAPVSDISLPAPVNEVPVSDIGKSLPDLGQFRIVGYSSGQVIFSRTHQQPKVGITNILPECPDQWFTLIPGTGSKEDLYAIKSVHTGVLYSRRGREPRVSMVMVSMM